MIMMTILMVAPLFVFQHVAENLVNKVKVQLRIMSTRKTI